MAELLTAENLIALLTLASLEIVLGIDNVVFIAILTGRLDPSVQKRAQRIGLLLAMVMRILLLLAISWIMGLEADLFTVAGVGLSGKDLILLAGGLFLIAKATYEIHHKLEVPDPHDINAKAKAISTFGAAIGQIVMIDLVFSIDSVITAVGMVKHISIMVIAIVAAVGVMLIFASSVSTFIEKHPTMKMLALSFLLLIGVMLTADGLGHHIQRGYIYFAMGFSFVVELLNMRVRAIKAGMAAAQPAGAK